MSLWENKKNSSSYSGDLENIHQEKIKQSSPVPPLPPPRSPSLDNNKRSKNIKNNSFKSWIETRTSKLNCDKKINKKKFNGNIVGGTGINGKFKSDSSRSSSSSGFNDKMNDDDEDDHHPNFKMNSSKSSVSSALSLSSSSISSSSANPVKINSTSNKSANNENSNEMKNFINDKLSLLLSSSSTSSLSSSNLVEKNSISEMNSFLLPRIILKHNSSSASNSISSKPIEDVNNFNKITSANTTKSSNCTEKLPHSNEVEYSELNECCDKIDHHHHHHSHIIPHNNNHSTEKSGSSGYYGSNVYSTSSVDEHIYSEPVIEKNFNIKQNKLINPSSLSIMERHSINLINVDYQMQRNNNNNNNNNTSSSNSNIKLPPIMEGIDGQIPRPVWPTDFDDSLIDINLESFLLSKEKDENDEILCETGVINEVFQSDEHDDLNHNNHNDDLDNRSIRDESENSKTKLVEVKNNSIDKLIYNLSAQQTREILEEIRRKLINLLEKSPTDTSSSSSSTLSSNSSVNSSSNLILNPSIKHQITSSNNIENNNNNNKNNEMEVFHSKVITNQNPIDLQNEIKNLKNDIDEYIRVINKKNELEIKQLCDGLSRNSKLLTMKKALENRASGKFQQQQQQHQPLQHKENFYEIFGEDEIIMESGYEKMKPPINLTKYCDNSSDNDDDKNKAVKLNFDTVYVRDGFCVNGCDQIEEIHTSNNSNSLCKTNNSINNSNNNNKNNTFISVSRQTSIRSVDNPNFHFQRKSTTNAFSVCMDIQKFSDSENNSSDNKSDTNIKSNLSLHKPTLLNSLGKPVGLNKSDDITKCDDKTLMNPSHKDRPSIWELYYGSKRLSQSNVKRSREGKVKVVQSMLSYPSTRPESDFTLDLPRAEQLRIKMKKEKQFRYRCRILTTFFSLIFFLLTVMVVSLLLTRGKRMFGSML